MGDFLVELVGDLMGGLVPEEPARKLTGVLMLVACVAFVGFAGFLAYLIAFRDAGLRSAWTVPLFLGLAWWSFGLARKALARKSG